tara:strand:+ start:626 stop:1084 length:459 start_codon:yes stop_codon:yes gene_type:complete
MAEISSYPIITPKAQDVLVGTETYVASVAEVLGNPTRGFTVQSIVDLAVVGTYLSVTGGTISGDLTIDGALALKAQTSGPNQGFGVLNTEGGVGAILVNGTLNITDSIVMQGTNANITLTNPGGFVALTSPNQTTYKITVDDQGNLETTQIS